MVFLGDLLKRFSADGELLRMPSLPVVESETEHDERHAPEHAPPRPFVADRQPRAAEKFERGLAADHGEDEIIVQRAFAICVL